MGSDAKRTKYVSENEEFSSSSGENAHDEDYAKCRRKKRASNKLSRNAIMARENRLRKKLYLESLEKENRRLKTDQTNSSKILESQAVLINDLRKEIQYLKSVIVNSTDIGTIIRSIQHNTAKTTYS